MFSRHKQSSPLAGPTKWYVAEEPATATDADTHEQARAEADALVEDYLDHVSAQLLALPRERRVEMRREINQHVAALAQAHEELGAGPADAAQAALKRFGDPAKIGRAFAATWKQPLTWKELTAFPAAALKQGLLWFGAAGVLFAGGATLAVLTSVTLETAQIGDRTGMVAALALPLLAGWQVGRTAPARAALGTFYALALLAFGATPFLIPSLHSSLAGLPEPLAMETVMYAAWMPLGCAAAAVSGALARRPGRFRLAR